MKLTMALTAMKTARLPTEAQVSAQTSRSSLAGLSKVYAGVSIHLIWHEAPSLSSLSQHASLQAGYICLHTTPWPASAWHAFMVQHGMPMLSSHAYFHTPACIAVLSNASRSCNCNNWDAALRLRGAEDAVVKAGGIVIRLVGLYHAYRQVMHLCTLACNSSSPSPIENMPGLVQHLSSVFAKETLRAPGMYSLQCEATAVYQALSANRLYTCSRSSPVMSQSEIEAVLTDVNMHCT